jgi:predicted porin
VRAFSLCLILATLAPACVLAQAAPDATRGTAATADIDSGCRSFKEFAATDCPLTWHGITFFGRYDAGIGWVSHGLPISPYNYEGESLVNRNATHSRWLFAPNNLSVTGLGIKGKEGLGGGWSVVFNASTAINPQSGELANTSATNIANNGLPRGSYAEATDGSRAGQVFNDELFGGIAADHLGMLTFGRQRALGADAVVAYDPTGGANGFSYIGYSGTMAGGGDTEDSRWDNATKYRLAYGPVHAGLMYKFAGGSGGCYSAAATWSTSTCTAQEAHNTAYGFDLGAQYAHFAADLIYQHYNQAISVLNPLLGPQSPTQPYESTINSINTHPIAGANLVSPDNTLYGNVTDNSALLVGAKYAWDPLKFFAGYEHIRQTNPSNPLGVGASDQGGYILSGVEDNSLDSPKVVQIWWTGLKYAIAARTDMTGSWYHQLQNDFRVPSTCSTLAGFRSSCAGTLNELSLYVDHHLSERFDLYAGIAYSVVRGGLAIAIPHSPGVPYNHDSNTAPTIGGRFSF